jgi:hypothetical protein
MLANDYLGYFYHHHNNDKCLFIDRTINHSDLTLNTGQWAKGGPYRAVAELDPQFWEFSTLPYNNGLTILRKKYSNKFFQLVKN